MVALVPAACFINIGKGIACVLFGLFLSAGIFVRALAQEAAAQGADSPGTIPEALRRPERGEAPRYPSDMVIGALGQGESPQGAYLFARDLLSALIRGSNSNEETMPPEGVTEKAYGEIKEEVTSLRPRSYRLGGGRAEPDGCVSFLVRFLGQDESIAGELFVRQGEEDKWILDDLILEEKKALSEIRDSYRYDFSPYERFY